MIFQTDNPVGVPDSILLARKNNRSTKTRRLKALLKRDGHSCRYCKRETHLLKHPYATTEHILPTSRGGNNDMRNLGVSCLECNQMKGNMTDDEFMLYLGHLYKINQERIKNVEEEEKIAYMYGASMGAEYLKSIGKTDLAQLSGDEALTFAECVCKNYHLKLVEQNA